LGCSSIRSQFDELHLVYASGQAEPGMTPSGFRVTLEEIISLVPILKVGFRIYADQEAYYIREELDTIGIKSIAKTDSEHAKKYGLRILGTTRAEFEFLKEYQSKNRFYTLENLSKQLLERNIER